MSEEATPTIAEVRHILDELSHQEVNQGDRDLTDMCGEAARIIGWLLREYLRSSVRGWGERVEP